MERNYNPRYYGLFHCDTVKLNRAFHPNASLFDGEKGDIFAEPCEIFIHDIGELEPTPPANLGQDPDSSLPGETAFIAKAIRNHWGIENGLHWVMDMLFKDEESRVRKGNAAANITTIKHTASNLLRNNKKKISLRQKRHLAAWDDDLLVQVIDQ